MGCGGGRRAGHRWKLRRSRAEAGLGGVKVCVGAGQGWSQRQRQADTLSRFLGLTGQPAQFCEFEASEKPGRGKKKKRAGQQQLRNKMSGIDFWSLCMHAHTSACILACVCVAAYINMHDKHRHTEVRSQRRHTRHREPR